MEINKDNVREYLFEKFGDISFIEESHQYFIDEQEYTPVSSIIEEYEEYVDWDKKAHDYAKKYVLDVNEVKKKWKLNNLRATISGTRVHEFGESYVNVMLGHPELICKGTKKQYIKEYNTLVPTCPKEEAIISFYKELNEGQMIKLYPVGTELKLSTKYIKGARPICGTTDVLFWGQGDFGEKGFVIGDYKTNKSLYNDYKRTFNETMKYPFNHFVDDAFSHYVLQFNLYQRMLESVGVKIIDRVLIWLKENEYERIFIPKLSDELIDKVIIEKS